MGTNLRQIHKVFTVSIALKIQLFLILQPSTDLIRYFSYQDKHLSSNISALTTDDFKAFNKAK